MTNLASTILPKLEAERFPGIDAGPGALYPNYQGYSLANIPASVCRWLGVPPFGIQPLADEIHNALPGSYQHVILLLVDGFGLNHLQQAIRIGKETGRNALWNDLAERGTLAPLTSIVPSTTSAALTSLWTGRTAAEHGVVGYEMYLKEYGLNANMILHSPASFQGDVGSLRRAGFNPETFLPVATLGPHLAQNGVQPFAFQHRSIAYSGLSTMLFPQVNVIPFRTLSDLTVTLSNHQQAHTGQRMYTYIYWGELDELSHGFGPNNERVELEFSNFTLLLEHFISLLKKNGRGDTLLLVTADHGHLDTPKQSNLELRNHPELLSYLHLLPSGESRLAYLFARPGSENKIRSYLNHALPGRFVLLPSDTVRQAGLLGGGKHHPRLADRIGDWVLVAQDHSYLWWADKDNPLLGRHGGLSRTEMLIPLLGVVF